MTKLPNYYTTILVKDSTLYLKNAIIKKVVWNSEAKVDGISTGEFVNCLDVE